MTTHIMLDLETWGKTPGSDIRSIGALNSLGVVTGDFVEAWSEMTADDNCTLQKGVIL